MGACPGFGMLLSYVVKECVPDPDAIVVCVVLRGVIVWVEIQIVIMQPPKGEEGHEEVPN